MKHFELIRQWASERGIYEKGDVKTQYIKLQEEAGELAKAILKEDPEEFIDAIGDCVVVLTNLAELGGVKIEYCIESAWDEIKDRKGKMENGTFKKNQKPQAKAKWHKNGYYNLPCKYTEILTFAEHTDIVVEDEIMDPYELIKVAKPSKNFGVAFVYKTDL